jgi:hypothetical protein
MVVAAAGGAPTTLDGMDGLSADERGDVAWSPDGTRLAVSLRSRDLRIVSAGSGQTLVTVMSVSDEFPPFTSDSGRHLAWSPDGSQLTFVGAFADGSNEGNGLLVVTASGGDAREVPGVEVSEGGIDWQPLQAPVTTITTAPAAVTTARDARFEFIASKRPATFECRLDEQPWTACATGVDYAGLTLGPHVFRVRAESRGIAEERPPEYIWRVESSPQPGPRPDQPFPERTAIRARWYRYVFPRHMVEFRSLRAVRVPAGATIDVRCEGPGCPRGFHRQWRTRRFRVSRPILKGLDGRRLVRRAAVFVTITKPGYVGMGKMYCVRYNRRVRVRPYTLDRRQPKCGPTAAVERRSVLPP